MKKTRWTIVQLKDAVKKSESVRQVIILLGLKPAGGNYEQISSAIKRNTIDISHFRGRGWKANKKFDFRPHIELEDILKNGTSFQSFKLKKRLFFAGIKKPVCELCGWSKMSEDGRIPIELDHINGDRHDNRLENLRILCPNCHSLQPTHRGLNQKRRGDGMVDI